MLRARRDAKRRDTTASRPPHSRGGSARIKTKGENRERGRERNALHASRGRRTYYMQRMRDDSWSPDVDVFHVRDAPASFGTIYRPPPPPPPFSPPLLALTAAAARGVPAAFTSDAMPPDARSPRRGAAKNDHQVSRLPLCHTYGLRARARTAIALSRTQSRGPRHLFTPLPRSSARPSLCPPACLPASPLVPPLSFPPARLTPPPRYRYHNNGIIAIPAACYTMTLATVGSVEYTRKRETGRGTAQRNVVQPQLFQLWISPRRIRRFDKRFARESPTTCSIRAVARVRQGRNKRAPRESCLQTKRPAASIGRESARSSNRCPVTCITRAYPGKDERWWDSLIIFIVIKFKGKYTRR